MDHNGVVVNKPEFKSSRSRSFPGWGECDLLFNVNIVNLLLKKQWRRDRRPNVAVFAVWSALIVGGG